jgi:hypothetical protein
MNMSDLTAARAKTVHMSVCVRGLLGWDKRRFRQACKWMLREDGSQHTPESLREALLDALSEGWEALPMGKCDDFDPKTGCRGHVA